MKKTRSFIKRIALGGALSSAISLLLLGCGQIGDPEAAAEEPQTIAERLSKVDICHEPPGNPDNGQMISIGEAALDAHSDHGDPTNPSCYAGGELPFSDLLMCHYNGDGTFSEVLVDGESVATRLASGDIIGHCASLMCGDS